MTRRVGGEKQGKAARPVEALDEPEHVLGFLCKRRGAMSHEEVPAAESPEHRDARQPGVGGSLKVDVGVTDIDCLGREHAELAHSLAHHVGFGLPWDAGTLAYRHVNQAVEEATGKLCHAFLHFVAHHSHTVSLGMERHEKGGNARVERCMVLAMNHIVRSEGIETLFPDRRTGVLRHSSLNEFPDAVAHESAHFVEGSLGQPAACERIVCAAPEVLQRVGERTVKVEYHSFVLHGMSFRAAKIRRKVEYWNMKIEFCTQKAKNLLTLY